MKNVNPEFLFLSREWPEGFDAVADAGREVGGVDFPEGGVGAIDRNKKLGEAEMEGGIDGGRDFEGANDCERIRAASGFPERFGEFQSDVRIRDAVAVEHFVERSRLREVAAFGQSTSRGEEIVGVEIRGGAEPVEERPEPGLISGREEGQTRGGIPLFRAFLKTGEEGIFFSQGPRQGEAAFHEPVGQLRLAFGFLKERLEKWAAERPRPFGIGGGDFR